MPRTKANARRHRRVTVRILVDYQIGSAPRCDYATTLGAGGLFIECEEPLPSNTLLKLRFRLGEQGELHELEGRVTWRRTVETDGLAVAPGMGVQFTAGAATARLARELDHLE